MRLPRKYSMKQHLEFSRTRKEGVAKGGAYLVLSTTSDPELKHHKVGIIVTRKIGNAVTRNLLKRRIHAILAGYIDKISQDKGKYRYIVTVLRWKAPQATQQQLEQDWLKQAHRLGLLTPDSTEGSPTPVGG
ncbi:MAG: ribonuclease P protein component [Verrucomicrobiae bacterium]|nr:ribonuclease P protein component [Verrucomicrobiae bacterium]NNJ86571.1 ribonuclease P protein component [Akkermansiaceae bacterium]